MFLLSCFVQFPCMPQVANSEASRQGSSCSRCFRPPGSRDGRCTGRCGSRAAGAQVSAMPNSAVVGTIAVCAVEHKQCANSSLMTCSCRAASPVWPGFSYDRQCLLSTAMLYLCHRRTTKEAIRQWRDQKAEAAAAAAAAESAVVDHRAAEERARWDEGQRQRRASLQPFLSDKVASCYANRPFH